jgi:hypothetical protein
MAMSNADPIICNLYVKHPFPKIKEIDYPSGCRVGILLSIVYLRELT